MEKNQLNKSFLLVLLTFTALFIISIAHIDQLGLPFEVKPVDIFSDIRKDKKTAKSKILTVQPDSLSTNCPKDIVCIENFTGQKLPLQEFFGKLQVGRNSKVRIAWFGDSFTDADLVVGDLRDTLQSVYGGNGVGFLPITSEAPGFRQTILHSFYGWRTSSVVAPKGMRNYGINGYVYAPDSANYVQYAGTRRFKHTKSFGNFKLFYEAHHAFQANITINDTIKESVSLSESALPSVYDFRLSKINKVKVRIPDYSGVNIFGASLEDETGLYIDNFSVKGNPGMGLLSIPQQNLAAFDSLLNYDLIVLQFGLNAVTAKTTNFDGYMRSMKKVLTRLNNTFPGVPVLLLSVSDRSERIQGEYVTMKSIEGLVDAQRTFAYENKLLFWNLFEAMGGENSMAGFVAAHPPLANKDYTHLNFAGGRKIGLSLAKSILYEQKKYGAKK
jgi:lysophospholipase L1-like esterase